MAAAAEPTDFGAHLSNAPINILSLAEHARRELTRILNANPGSKVLVLDEHVLGPLNLIAPAQFFRDNGVQLFKQLSNDMGPVPASVQHVLYMVRPRPQLMKLIANHIHDLEADGQHKTYSVYFVPRRTMLCERVLAEQGVYGDITTEEFHLDLIPFEEDVLSLEMPLSFRECFLEGDPTSLYYVARSIMKLQTMFGLIPLIQGKGDNAYQVANLMQRMRSEVPADHFSNIAPEIASIVIIDRNVDMVTPLMHQFTYEGLIDEVYGIENGMVQHEEEERPKPGQRPTGQTVTKKVSLNSSDTLFAELRDLNFRVLGPILHKKAEDIKQTYAKKDQENLSIQELKQFFQEFKSANEEHNFLQLHIGIAQNISQVTKSTVFDKRVEAEQSLVSGRDDAHQYIEGLIAKQEPLVKVLRLLCLLSITTGIKAKRYNFLRQEIIQTYGYTALFTLTNLEQMGLFVGSSAYTSKSSWPGIRRALRLYRDPETLDLKNPDDISYTFGGYAPLSVRLVELACTRQGWKPIAEVMNALPGRTFEIRQPLPPSVQERASLVQTGSSKKRPVTLVFFVGGVTHSEIAALRFLRERETVNRDFVVATTKLINGTTLLEPLLEEVRNSLRLSTLQ